LNQYAVSVCWAARLRLGAAIAVAIVSGCAGATPSPRPTPLPTQALTANPTPTASSTIRDIMGLEKFAPLEPGTYSIDPDSDPSTPLRVIYEVPVEGWSQWFGAVKGTDDGHVMMNITTVVNLVRHACGDHSWADPPVGPSVDDLATALADLAPFLVTSLPERVTIYGHSGKYLELTVPDLPVSGDDFTGCVDGNLLSWVAPIDVAEGEGGAFHAYNAEPGRTEEFWILDVDGARIVIESNWSPASPPGDVAEIRAILDSIRIEP
jgi:hypothetical protein